MAESYYVYVLRSLKDDNFYTGHTADLKDRLVRHNRGDVRSTKSRRPFVIVYYESCGTRSEAMKRERKVKSLGHDGKVKLIQSFKPPE